MKPSQAPAGKIAVVQMVSGNDVGANLIDAAKLLEEARGRGAQLAVLPENFGFLGAKDRERVEVAEPPGFLERSGGALDETLAEQCPMQAFLSHKARQLGLWLVGGTLPVRSGQPDLVHSACLVVDARGRLAARYDKIHLFDVGVPGKQEQYRESASTLPGSLTVLQDTPLGRMGCAVCYDVRFPEQFRHMQAQGMDFVALPAAFTETTGRAHWSTLIRARAIENLSLVAAAAQGGEHASGRQTYGHSMIVDAWGNTLVELDKGPGVAVAELDLTRQAAIRERFPALSHRRFQVQ